MGRFWNTMAGLACIAFAVWLWFFSHLQDSCCILFICIIIGCVGVSLLGEKD